MPMDTKNSGAYKQPLAFDAATKRRFDDNGFMHVDSCHITKEQVAPYYGYEIPDAERFGLEPNKIYYGYRSAEELKKALPTFNGLPLLLHHHPESADEPQKQYRVGSVGTSAEWDSPYIDNVLSITDKAGIKAVMDGTCRQISSAYQYDPDFTKGEFDGQPYDFVMRNIRGNHVALVEQGRAGPDVVVSDSQITNHQPRKESTLMMRLKDFFRGAWDNDLPEDVTEDSDDKVVKVKAIIESLGDVIPPEKLKELHSILDEMAEPAAEDEDKPEDAPVDPVDSLEDESTEEILEEKEEEAPEAEPEAEDEDEDFDNEEYVGEEEVEEEAEDEEEDPSDFIEANSAADEAWGKCGIDSDDPAVKAAFAKGFSWGMKDGEKNGERAEEKMKVAQDAAIDRATKKLEAQFEAAAEVAPVIGSVKPMAFDSVSDIYAHALQEMGIPKTAFNAASAQDVFRIVVKQREVQMAQDNNLMPKTKFNGKFSGLNNIE